MNLGKVISLFIAAIVAGNVNLSSAAEKNKEEVKPVNTIVLDKNDKANAKFEANKLLFMTSKDDDSTLIFSDSPETVKENGILYESQVKGDGRLLYYHLNETGVGTKVAVIVENLTNKDNTVRISREATAGPSADYLYVGKTTLKRYFANQEAKEINLPPYGKALLNEEDGKRIVSNDGLVYGLFDFNAKRNVKMSVVMAPINAYLTYYPNYSWVLPKDEQRLRGTYKGANRYMTTVNPYNPKMGRAYFYVGDNRTDLYKYGTDETDNSTTQNFGNYGVLYEINPKLSGVGKTSFYLKPIGGVYAGAISVRIGKDGEKKMVLTPDELPFYGHEANKNYYSYLGTYNNSDDIYFEYMAPGASNLPVQFILIPEKAK